MKLLLAGIAAGIVAYLFNKKLNTIIMANERIDAALATLSAKQSEAATSIDGIAADITFLKDDLPATGGMTEAEVTELTTKLEEAASKATSAADALKSLDDSTDSAGNAGEEGEQKNP
jgi:hypothetical protein